MRFVACVFAFGCLIGFVQAGEVADFALPDVHGNVHKLGDYSDKKIVVIAVLGTECPLAKLYGTQLQTLADEYEPKGVAFLGVDGNRQDTLAEIGAFAHRQAIKFPLLKDQPQKSDGKLVVDRLAAERTPEVFVLDAQRRVRYHGRVDDQYSPGVVRPKATRRDLALALDELLAGERVSVPTTPIIGCHIGRERTVADASNDQPKVTYSHQIVRLFNEHCVRCHRPGEIAPFALTSYDDAVSWADTIVEVVDDERMPPWFASPEHGHFANTARMTDEQKQLVRDWVAGGCVEGDRSQVPEPPQFTEGWQIPPPDVVFHIADKPVQIPATGEVAYRYFVVDLGFTEDKWVQYAEARPDNREVVHHIVVMFRDPKSKARDGSSARGGLVGYAPGMPPCSYPAGTAFKIPAGTKLIFQMHYTPNGRPAEDRSYVGFKFVDEKDVKTRISGGVVGNRKFAIPAEASNYEVVAEETAPVDLKLLTLTPHMHLRGKSFKYELQYPDGERKVLLDIPRWDFNWQLRYDLAEPVTVPKGSKLICTAHYDNSPRNLSNPDPTVEVRWGDQTWEEMMLGYFTAIPADGSLADTRPKKPSPGWWDRLRKLL
ncbi:MAG TPA: redoxin domain-containing protein [Pirellulales bacterium]|nr:redoxin domain-containing protein [Pirellulales bacterium]